WACGFGVGCARLDRHKALGADRPRPAVVLSQPLEPQPHPGGSPALYPSVSVGSDHRDDPVVLGLCGADGGRAADPRHLRGGGASASLVLRMLRAAARVKADVEISDASRQKPDSTCR